MGERRRATPRAPAGASGASAAVGAQLANDLPQSPTISRALPGAVAVGGAAACKRFGLLLVHEADTAARLACGIAVHASPLTSCCERHLFTPPAVNRRRRRRRPRRPRTGRAPACVRVGAAADTPRTRQRHIRDNTCRCVRRGTDMSETRPRHVRDTSATRAGAAAHVATCPGHVRDTSTTTPPVQVRPYETRTRHVRDTSETRPRHVRDTSATSAARPPGHHASRDGFEGGFAEGGCFYNSVGDMGRCGGDVGEIWRDMGRCGGFYAREMPEMCLDISEIYPRYTRDTPETHPRYTRHVPRCARAVSSRWRPPRRRRERWAARAVGVERVATLDFTSNYFLFLKKIAARRRLSSAHVSRGERGGAR